MIVLQTEVMGVVLAPEFCLYAANREPVRLLLVAVRLLNLTYHAGIHVFDLQILLTMSSVHTPFPAARQHVY